jgi:hypothetical protein
MRRKGRMNMMNTNMNYKDMTIEEILFLIRQYAKEKEYERSSEAYYSKVLDELCEEVKRRVNNA